MDAPIDIAELRGRLRRDRARISEARQRDRATAVATRFRTLPAWAGAGHIAIYVAVAGELDVSELVHGNDPDRRSYVPVVDGGQLRFAPSKATAWAPNRFGIPEPTGVTTITASELDIVVVPAVAVDRSGHRIGMGAGFYDRTFAWLLGTDRPSRPLLVAAVHDEQVVERLVPQAWDVPMDAIVTPSELIIV